LLRAALAGCSAGARRTPINTGPLSRNLPRRAPSRQGGSVTRESQDAWWMTSSSRKSGYRPRCANSVPPSTPTGTHRTIGRRDKPATGTLRPWSAHPCECTIGTYGKASVPSAKPGRNCDGFLAFLRSRPRNGRSPARSRRASRWRSSPVRLGYEFLRDSAIAAAGHDAYDRTPRRYSRRSSSDFALHRVPRLPVYRCAAHGRPAPLACDAQKRFARHRRQLP
jgi:hypothetical protein